MATRQTEGSQVAKTILQQLGGKQFITMTGSRGFTGGADRLQFIVGKGANRQINKVVVILDPSDTYTVQFWHIDQRAATFQMKLLESQSDVYADNLRDVFTEHTGFWCSLR